MTANHLPKNLLLKNTRIIDPVKMKEFEGDIQIRNGNIEAVGADLPEDGGETINVDEKLLPTDFVIFMPISVSQEGKTRKHLSQAQKQH